MDPENNVKWLVEAGLPEAELEIQGDLLIIKLPPASRVHLLSDPVLRESLTSHARALGFSRIALELTQNP